MPRGVLRAERFQCMPDASRHCWCGTLALPWNLAKYRRIAVRFRASRPLARFAGSAQLPNWRAGGLDLRHSRVSRASGGRGRTSATCPGRTVPLPAASPLRNIDRAPLRDAEEAVVAASAWAGVHDLRLRLCRRAYRTLRFGDGGADPFRRTKRQR